MSSPSRRVLIPEVPVAAADWTTAVILNPTGEITTKPSEAAGQYLASARPILCHAPAVAAHLRTNRFAAADVLELFAFTHPATFCLPTVGGLADVLQLPPPKNLDDQPMTLLAVVKKTAHHIDSTLRH